MRQSLKVKATKHSTVFAVILQLEFPKSAAGFIQD